MNRPTRTHNHMFTDALGNVHWEFWEGVAWNGRRYQSVELFRLCRDWGTNMVRDAVFDLDLCPSDDNLKKIKKYIEQSENSLV